MFALLVAAVPTAGPRTIVTGAASVFPTHAGVSGSPTASANPIAEFPIPNSNNAPFGIVGGPDGNLWFAGNNAIGRITTTGAITAFPIPTANGQLFGPAIVAGPDGNLWFTQGGNNKIGRMTTAGVTTEFPITTSNSQPADIAAGADGNLWFTERAANRIGRITTAGTITEFPIATAGSSPQGITAGPNGNLWFTQAAGEIGLITTAGAITEFPAPQGSQPYDIAVGPDGNLWFTEQGSNFSIGRITPAGIITEFPLGGQSSPGAGIVAGPDGNLWFAQQFGGLIGRITTAGVITKFSIPYAYGAVGIAAGADGNLWFTEPVGNKVGRITTTGVITEFPVPGGPSTIAAGPAGNLWFTQSAEIGQITTAGAVTEFPLRPASSPRDIAAGLDGNLWFIDVLNNASIGRLTTAGAITEFPVPSNELPTAITAGPDGNLWFADPVGRSIGRITTAGVITEFPVPGFNIQQDIAAGPDGNLWFTEGTGIGRITTAGVITEFPVPGGGGFGIAAGPDGNLWVTRFAGIGRITTAGVITEYPIPTANSFPQGIAAGPDGNLWFTESAANQIARITTAGVVTEFPIPTPDSSPTDIVTGPDRNLWFTEQSANQIGRLTPGLGLPTHVQAVAGDGEATLTWIPPPNAGPAITGYTVTASPGGAMTTVSPLVPAATVTGLTNGTAYTFTVAGVNSVGTGPASLPSTAVTPTAVAQGPSVAVLPAMSNLGYGGYLTAAYFQNLGASAAHIRVQYFDTTGTAVGFGNSVAGLVAGGTWTLRTDNGHSLASLQPGSAIVYSDQPLAVFVNEFAPGNSSDATSYTAISVASGTANTIYAPAIANNAYGGYTTGIGLVNLSASAVNITVTYRDGTGAVAKTQTLNSVAGGAYVPLYSGDPALGLPNPFAGTATISSSGGNLAAVVNETGPGGQFSSYDAVPAGSTTLYAPVALNNAFGGYNTGMGIQNTTGSAGTVTINYYDASGTPTTTSFPIVANGYLGVYQGNDIPVAGAYTAKLTSTVAIAAIVNEVAPSGTAAKQSTAYNTFAAGSSSLHLPLVGSAGPDGWSTGEGIMNTGAAMTTLTVTYYDTATGVQVGTPQSLSLQPNAFWGLYQPAGGLPNGLRASAVVTTAAGGQVAVICNESNATSFMSYTGQ